MSEPRCVRVFIAIQLPPEPREELGRLLDQLRRSVPPKCVRWSRAESLHLTLRFLGDVPAGEVDAVKSSLETAVRGVGPFELCLDGVGCFPDMRAPRVLWVGTGGALKLLDELQAGVQQATGAWGKPEMREFHPHVTLGRVNTRQRTEVRAIGEAIAQCHVACRSPWRAEAVHLMQSVQGPGSSQYTTLASIALAA